MNDHPCQGKCPHFEGEQCCHCLVQEVPASSNPDEKKHLESAMQSIREVS